MAENSRNGCMLWISTAIAIVVFIMGGYTSVTNATLSSVPTSPASDSVLVVTITPPETDVPFVVENNQIIYIHSETLGKPCYYEMAGRVLDSGDQPFTNFVVNIKMLGEFASESLGYAFPGEGLAQHGLSGWASVLPQSPVDYEIWLTTKVGGEELSPHILIQPQGCDYNMAIINFVQAKPLS